VRATRRILAEAQGNPLALLELPHALTASTARETIPTAASGLPLSRRLQSLYAGRVEALPHQTRRALLLAALEGAGDIAVLAAADADFELAHVAPAERGGWSRWTRTGDVCPSGIRSSGPPWCSCLSRRPKIGPHGVV
jgi:hypothetical protein